MVQPQGYFQRPVGLCHLLSVYLSTPTSLALWGEATPFKAKSSSQSGIYCSPTLSVTTSPYILFASNFKIWFQFVSIPRSQCSFSSHVVPVHTAFLSMQEFLPSRSCLINSYSYCRSQLHLPSAEALCSPDFAVIPIRTSSLPRPSKSLPFDIFFINYFIPAFLMI